jgi:hypothetical protein
MKNLVTLTETYLLPKNYKKGDFIPLREPILITANGLVIYQNEKYVTETREITKDEYDSQFSGIVKSTY